MKIADFLRADAVIELSGSTSDAILAELSMPLAHSTGIDPAEIAKTLIAREGLGTTAVGEGCAVPHGRVPGLERIVGAFGRSRAGVEFRAADGKPVRLYFALLAPSGTPAPYLNALALVSRSFKSQPVREALLAAPDVRALYRTLELTAEGDGNP